MRLTWMIGTASFLVLLLSLGLLAFLGLHKFERQLEEVLAARIAVTAVDARRAIEHSLGLGLPLADARGIQAIVERAAAADSQIAAIAVIDLDGEPGQALFFSGAPVRLDPADIERHRHETRWQWMSGHGNTVSGWPLVDPLHRRVGLLAIEVRRDRQARLIEDAGRRVMLAAAILALFMLVTIVFAMKRIVAPLERTIRRTRRILAGSPAEAAQGDLERLAGEFMQATGDTRR